MDRYFAPPEGRIFACFPGAEDRPGQRRMAELVHSQQTRQSQENERIARLEQEVSRLKEQLAENIIAFDDRRSIQQRIQPPPAPLESQKH